MLFLYHNKCVILTKGLKPKIRDGFGQQRPCGVIYVFHTLATVASSMIWLDSRLSPGICFSISGSTGLVWADRSLPASVSSVLTPAPAYV
jgi:hypothetical protein